ncbi:CCA tRNA nucleotidyltransferase [archaeon]|nr:CCA tRNA nucleotidyltransferase [archaeon]|tara:strand:- start:4942 stop:6156 length:1215 start_codon:yes stop_codon:yes gene_type:complete
MKILQEVKPSKKEEEDLKKISGIFVRKLNMQLKKINALAVIGGSFAKGTWLKGDHDIDIYVKFNYLKYKDKKIDDILEKQLAFTFSDYVRVHGSRDYFQIKREKFTFEIVPILDIKKEEEMKNITDMSLFHVDFVKENLTAKMKNEVRILKSYLKALKLYGAESYIKGFSGYVSEILIYRYKSFKKLVEGSKEWKMKEVIDVMGYYKGDVFDKINIEKYSPLIVVDPVQKERNAAAALSVKNFNEFLYSVKNFNERQFSQSRIDIKYLRKLSKETGTELFFIEFKSGEGKEDVVGSKILKVLKYIKERILVNDFHIFKSGWVWDKEEKGFFWFLVNKENLPVFKKHFGPPIWEVKHCDVFVKKWEDKKVYVENNCLYVEKERKYRRVLDLLRDVKKEKFDKVKF